MDSRKRYLSRVPQPLADYLHAYEGNHLTLTFEEVERIQSAPLPQSARTYSGWWRYRRWHELGWHMSLSLAAQTVTFSRL